MAIVWFSDEDRERMRAEEAAVAEIRAELYRLYELYARPESREPSPIPRRWSSDPVIDIRWRQDAC
jgi:hypothetical protein